ncbi:MAG: hypothetical protein KAF27_01750 [Porphyrobacter sp.]|nr:hypothetical protein [Porphyrobacter sp.]
MTDPGKALAQAALGMVGCPFRLHGRDPASGLDCVGLVAAALAATGARPIAPTGYGLRNLGVDPWLPLAAGAGLAPVSGEVRAGDILLIALGFAQHHLATAVDETGVVHAHAGLRCVVHQPRDPAWHISAHWRIAPDPEG